MRQMVDAMGALDHALKNVRDLSRDLRYHMAVQRDGMLTFHERMAKLEVDCEHESP